MEKRYFVKVGIGDDFSNPRVFPIYPPTDDFDVVIIYAHAELYVQGICLESPDNFRIVSVLPQVEKIEFDSGDC